jgi:hypothetical protein
LRIKYYILPFIILANSASLSAFCQAQPAPLRFNFYGDTIELPFARSSFVDFTDPLSAPAIQSFYDKMMATGFQPLIKALTGYKEQYKLDDWLYYQLIRRTAQYISPKAENYYRYTLYKWFFLAKSGYDASLRIDGSHLLFYVQSDETIYDIPYITRDGRQYVCLNYHDYGSIDFEKNKFSEVAVRVQEATKAFSYKITQLPDFTPSDYSEKELRFNVYGNEYHFKVKLNTQIQTIFANYPVVDYASYFNIPLSRETYSSLMPLLKKNIKGLSTKNGVDYLMRFTRYAFLFEPDLENFGKEKRLTPEQTLFYEHSDCEDRAALFFYLVREIYDLPMIVLSYPQHVTIAVKFDKPVGTPIVYNGNRYSICEPTPQKEDLQLGQLASGLKKTPYEIAYVYTPKNK